MEQYRKSFEKFQELLSDPYRRFDETPKEPSEEYKQYLEKVKSDPKIIVSDEKIFHWILQKLNRKAKNQSFEPSDKQRNLMNALWKYFKGIEGDFDCSKGILLFGAFGSGKTEILKTFVSAPFGEIDPLNKKYRITSAIEMIDHYNAEKNFEKYFDKDLYIDDFGTEQRAQYMSKDAEPILSKFIELWYIRRTHKLYMTSNLSRQELKDKYGGRVYSRMHDLFNIVEFNDKDYRI